MNFFKRNNSTEYGNLNVNDYYNDYYKPKTDHALIDVRTAGEFARGHVPGAVNISLDQLDKRLEEVPEGKTVVVICASGNRSRSGAAKFVKGGWKEVYNLNGGTMHWMMHQHPLET